MTDRITEAEAIQLDISRRPFTPIILDEPWSRSVFDADRIWDMELARRIESTCRAYFTDKRFCRWLKELAKETP